MDDELISSLLSGFLGDVASGAAGEFGAFPVAWILGAITGTSGSEGAAILAELEQIEDTLQQIQAELADLSEQLAEVEKQLILTVEWNTLISRISEPLADINAWFEIFRLLRENDVEAATELQQEASSSMPTLLITLHEAIVSNPLNPQPQTGLLWLWAEMNVQYATSGAWPNTNVGPGSPLDSAYRCLKGYFTKLLAVQIQGVTLLVNAYLAVNEANLAQNACQTFITRIGLQAQDFVAAAEMLTVTYCADLSLIGLVSGSCWTADPVRRASLHADAITGNDTFYVRIWNGSPSASTGDGLTALDGQTLSLSGYPPDTDTPFIGSFTVEDPARATWTWTLVRFAWTNPPNGVYSLEVSPTDNPLGMWLLPELSAPQVCGLWMDPTSPTQPLTSGYLPIIFSDTVRPGAGSVVLTGVSALNLSGLDQSVGLIGDEFNVGTGDFTFEAWIYPYYVRPQVILSNKCGDPSSNCDTSSNNGGGPPPGTSGVILQMNADGALQFKLAVDAKKNTIDYYSATTASLSLSLQSWHHVAAVRENYNLSIYVDGQPVDVDVSSNASASSMVLSSVGPLMVGGTNAQCPNKQPINPTNLFLGNVDDVRVWSTARSQQEIAAGMYARAIPQEGLLAAWSFAMGQPIDGSGLGGQFEFMNLAACTSSGFSSTRFPPAARPTQALAFDGTGRGYVQIPASNSLVIDNAMIVSVRVRLDFFAPRAEMTLVACGSFALAVVPVSSSLYPTVQVTVLGTDSTSCTAQGGEIVPGQWSSVRAVWSSGGYLEVYVDDRVAAHVSAPSMTLNPSGELYVGIAGQAQAAPLAGTLSNLALSGGSSGRYLGFWALDEGSGSVAVDTSGNENNGALQGQGLEYVDMSWLPAPGLALGVMSVPNNIIPKLVAAYQASDGTNHLVLAYDFEANAEPNFTNVSKQSTSGPVAVAGLLSPAIVYVADDRTKDLCVTWLDQSSGQWRFQRFDNQQASTCVAAVMSPNLGLCIAYDANDGSRDLCLTYSQDYQDWSFLRLGDQQVGGALAMTTWFDGFQLWLVIAYRANDGSNSLYVTWSSLTAGFPNFQTPPPVKGVQVGECLSVTSCGEVPGKVVVAFKANDGSDDLCLVYSSDLQNWTQQRLRDQQIGRSMAASSGLTSELVIAYQANDSTNQLYLTRTQDFSSWTINSPQGAIIGPA